MSLTLQKESTEMGPTVESDKMSGKVGKMVKTY